MTLATEVDAYVEANRGRFLDDLKHLCSFPSVSAEGEGALRGCLEWIGERAGRCTDRIEVLQEGGMPSLLVEVPGAGPRRLLLYSHYDVQPADPLSLWDSPPFEPTERNGRLYARGVCDDKADVMARLHAVEALRAIRGDLPLTLRLLIEGEEEIGSASFERIVEKHSSRLAADGCLWESNSWDASGRPQIHFGVRGLLYVELRVRMLNFDQHSASASLYPSASMYLVQALASLRDLDMRIAIPGFYDAVVPPDDRDRTIMAAIDPQLEARRELVGFDRLVGGPTPQQAIEQLLFTPTCNVAGLTAGYQGPGSKTVLPAEASAKLDFRLIPDQDPDDILAKLQRHLTNRGFDKVEVSYADRERPARSDPDSDIGRAVRETVGETLGAPVVWPFMSATGPMHPVIAGLGVPAVAPTGAGRHDSRIHAPNESVPIENYLGTIKLLCRIFERFAEPRA